MWTPSYFSKPWISKLFIPLVLNLSIIGYGFRIGGWLGQWVYFPLFDILDVSFLIIIGVYNLRKTVSWKWYKENNPKKNN